MKLDQDISMDAFERSSTTEDDRESAQIEETPIL